MLADSLKIQFFQIEILNGAEEILRTLFHFSP